MSYALFAICTYILLRGLQVLLEDKMDKPWAKSLIRGVTMFMIYAALAGMIVWYAEIPFLGFDPDTK